MFNVMLVVKIFKESKQLHNEVQFGLVILVYTMLGCFVLLCPTKRMLHDSLALVQTSACD